jgi:hypothetical protein
MNGAQQTFAKADSDKKWQLTATYVEVRSPLQTDMVFQLT